MIFTFIDIFVISARTIGDGAAAIGSRNCQTRTMGVGKFERLLRLRRWKWKEDASNYVCYGATRLHTHTLALVFLFVSCVRAKTSLVTMFSSRFFLFIYLFSI